MNVFQSFLVICQVFISVLPWVAKLSMKPLSIVFSSVVSYIQFHQSKLKYFMTKYTTLLYDYNNFILTNSKFTLTRDACSY